MGSHSVIKIFPALNGDSFLITIADTSILIDSGYADTYTKYIRPAISELQSQGRSLSLFITTHIDGDHISGGVKFLSENIVRPIISVDNIWHNSYRHLSTLTTSSVVDTYNGKPVESLQIKSIIKEENLGGKNISAEQGSSLASLIHKGKYNWNKHFKGSAVCLENSAIVKLTPSISVAILSPNLEKLRSLLKFWKKELFKLGYKVDNPKKQFDDAFEFIINGEKESKRPTKKDISSKKIDLSAMASISSAEDDRVSNGSSIAFSIEWENKKVLLLGDAHPSLIVDSLKKIYKKEQFPIKFDVIKIAHHGSIQNSSNDLLQLIDSEQFIISTNGKIFNHPDIETIARIVTRKVNFKRRIYFNYPTETAALLNDSELMKRYNYELIIGDGNQTIEIVI